MAEDSDDLAWSRRTALKTTAGLAMGGAITTRLGTKEASARLCQNDCESWPRRDTENTEIEREEHGQTVKYYTGAGFYLDYENVYFGGGRWHYEFRNEAVAGAAGEYEDGEKFKHDEYYADKHITVEEQNQTGEVNTDYYRDADWGYGVTSGRSEDYEWQDATKDTVNDIVGEFVPPIGAVLTLKDIWGHWKKAAKDDNRDNGVDVTWDGQTYQERTPHIGTYMLYKHTFPPKSDFPDSHVKISTKNKLDDVLFYSNGTERPNGDYSYLTEYKIYVKENPNNSSTSKLENKGIVPKKASEYLSEEKIEQHKFSADEVIYVDTNPEITAIREGNNY